MRVYYNENDKFAARWLRQLMNDGLIPLGEIDDRSITEVSGSDVRGFDQCHYFADIGGWPYALKLASWREPVWTGSCPCQPFSTAGQGKGYDDERHLWPEFYRLIEECRPATVFGEQVASKDGRIWLSGVRADLEELDYAFGAADLCAAGVEAPHIRQRLFWMAYTEGNRFEKQSNFETIPESDKSKSKYEEKSIFGTFRSVGMQSIDGLEYAASDRWIKRWAESIERSIVERCRENRLADSDGGDAEAKRLQRSREYRQQPEDNRNCEQFGRLAYTEGVRCVERGRNSANHAGSLSKQFFSRRLRDDSSLHRLADASGREMGRAGLAWENSVWIEDIEGKSRRIESGAFPLANGVSARVGRLRGYGNAIVPELAAEFVTSFMDIRDTLE